MLVLIFLTFLYLPLLMGVFAHLPGSRLRGLASQPTRARVKGTSPPSPTNMMELRNALEKRQDCSSFSMHSATCGYFYDSDPLFCASTDHCATSGSYLGCCSGVGCDVTPTNYQTACAEYTACQSSTVGYYTVCCGDLERPYCLTAITSIVKSSSTTHLTSFWCGNNQWSGIQTLSPTPYNWDASCTPTTPTNNGHTTTGATSVGTTTTVPPTQTGTTGPPVSAIAGGVVGGVAGLALIIAAIFFAFRWGKTKGQKQEPSGPQYPSYAMPPPQNNGPNSGEIPMVYAPAPTQFIYQSNEPFYQQSEPAPTTTQWLGSPGVYKTPVEEHVTPKVSPETPPVAKFPSYGPTLQDPRASHLSSAPTAVGSPREFRGPHELGVEREDGDLRELRG